MGIGQIDIDIETEDYIPTKDFINIQVDAIAQVAVDTSPKNIEIAMRNFLNKSSDDVRNTITKSLQGNLREIIGTMELKDICQNKAEFSLSAISVSVFIFSMFDSLFAKIKLNFLSR